MSAKKKEETKTTDDLQNGGTKTVEERLDELERRLGVLVRANCLLEVERAN